LGDEKAVLEGTKTVMFCALSRVEVLLVLLRRERKEVCPSAWAVVERGSEKVK
jgi:hypothetical protein